MNEPMKVTDKRAMTVLSDEPASSPAMSPVEVLMNAIQRNPNMDLAKLEKFMDLAERWRAAEAKREYVRAFAEFKQNMPPVVKDMINTQYRSGYSSLANLVNTANVYLGKVGLHANWKPHQEQNSIRIECHITHVGGHSESVSLAGPPDKSGSKNPLQEIKSTLTYLEGATFQAATGIVARDACADDDGKGAGNHAPEPKAPEGYEDWQADMMAVAEEGMTRLQDAWAKSDAGFRRHAAKNDGSWWNTTKNRAAKVQS